MKLDKKFIDELGNRRKATIGDIVIYLKIVHVENNNIQNLGTKLNQLEGFFIQLTI